MDRTTNLGRYGLFDTYRMDMMRCYVMNITLDTTENKSNRLLVDPAEPAKTEWR